MTAAALTFDSFGTGPLESWSDWPVLFRTLKPGAGGTGRAEGAAANARGQEALRATPVQEREADWAPVVRRCLRGDPLAWTELVRAHHGRVYVLCYRFTGSPQEAEDLTQDVFLKLYGNLKAFDAARGTLGVWVATLTRNHLVDHYRRSRLQRASESLDAGWELAPGEAPPRVSLEDSRPGPHAQAQQRELERRVQAALVQVSPELREAVILRDLEDRDYREIAAILHVPEGTVKSRISRGRAELARILRAPQDKRQVQ